MTQRLTKIEAEEKRNKNCNYKNLSVYTTIDAYHTIPFTTTVCWVSFLSVQRAASVAWSLYSQLHLPSFSDNRAVFLDHQMGDLPF